MNKDRIIPQDIELKTLLAIANQPVTFRVQRSDGVKNGCTDFFNDKGKVEASYMYVEDKCDYLESKGFEPNSMAELRQKEIRKQNKKKKLTDPVKMMRFYSISLGFYSLEVLYKHKLADLVTDIERLESIGRKIKSIPGVEHRIGRWCSAKGGCGCLGCANFLLGWNYQEYKDYMLYERAKASGIII